MCTQGFGIQVGGSLQGGSPSQGREWTLAQAPLRQRDPEIPSRERQQTFSLCTMTQEQPRAPRASLVVIQVWVFLSFNHHHLKSLPGPGHQSQEERLCPGKDQKPLMGQEGTAAPST